MDRNSNPITYVAYYRVSTRQQGPSGLGMQAQRYQGINFIGGQAQLVTDFIEVESGKGNAQPQLLNALAYARQRKARMVTTKLDRLSPNASFIFIL